VRPGRETFGSPDFTRRGEFYNAGSNKNLDIFKESFEEHSRRGNYIRIYPAYGTDIYNKYFASQRALNKDLYDMLFGSASAFAKNEKPSSRPMKSANQTGNTSMVEATTRKGSIDPRASMSAEISEKNFRAATMKALDESKA